MKIIIPCGGLGTRFKDLGPKPLVRALGKEVIRWVIDSLPKDADIVIPYNRNLTMYNFENFLKERYDNVTCIPIGPTCGTAETVYNCLSKDVDEPFISIDCDSFVRDLDYSSLCGTNSVVCIKTEDGEDTFSFYKEDDGFITEVAEKKKISDRAGCGVYSFKSSRDFMRFYSPLDGNEYRMSTIINQMIHTEKFTIHMVHESQFYCLGTPMQLMCFCNNVPVNSCTIDSVYKPGLRVCFDLDNTLVTPPAVKGDYTTVEPISTRINFCRYLKKMGCTIIIHTARRMKTHGGNMGKVQLDATRTILDTLEKFDVPCDELYIGKPYADMYIDDKAVNPWNIQSETGFYCDRIEPRSFNSLEIKDLIVTKTSNDLTPEIEYYKNIPAVVKDMFPLMINYNSPMTYSIEKVNGVSLSEILVAHGDIDETIFITLVNSLKRLHSIKTTQKFDLSEVYSKKLLARTSELGVPELLEYEKRPRDLCMIHGDPVFTNVLINSYGKLKFIDPRGHIGDHNTIYGDPMYDWAKVYQSLLGYDFVLAGKPCKRSEKLIGLLFENFTDHEIRDIKMITKSLVLSMVPLHDNKDFRPFLINV